jgi:predicted DNA-binding protein
MMKSKKVPIQIYLDPEQFKKIDILSKARNTSKAATIRECIAKYLESIPLENDPALNIMNLGASGKKDIAAKHDDYLIESQKHNPE